MPWRASAGQSPVAAPKKRIRRPYDAATPLCSPWEISETPLLLETPASGVSGTVTVKRRATIARGPESYQWG